MIKPDEALKAVLETVTPIGTEQISVLDALGRVVANKIISKRDIPIKDSSAMDGYAVYAEDLASDGATLKVLGVIGAGDDVSGMAIARGETYRIMTGAHLPAGADTVVERELSDDGLQIVKITEGKKRGANVRPAKDDIGVGDEVDCVGEVISPYTLSRFISVGALHTWVYAKPRVAVISTGSEIASPEDYDNRDKMLDANAPAIIGLLKEAGADCHYLGVVPDDEAKLLAALKTLKKYDVAVVSGGISAGDFDYMGHISEKAGLSWKFHHINQKPGKPMAFGTLDGVPIFGMPGNPVSCMFCAYFYLVPAIRKMQGMNMPENRAVTAVLGEEVKKKKGRIQFDRVKLEVKEGVIHAYPYSSQGSNLIDSMVKCHAFMKLTDEHEGVLKVGTSVQVYIFNSSGVF
ncbi:MAG: molybdopterin molybdotransferase MoeA [Deferribacteraceae bacterium]|jgi:molybdopterin molybdotransferase|nr:molybdopterin molybdotransferase MoeA [Deferribacteraceae bacterium]